MKALAFTQTLILLLIFDCCFAQRSVEAAQWHFGLMSNHMVVTEYTSGAEILKIRPLRTNYGLQIGCNIGEHWGFGINADARYRQGEYNIYIGNWPPTTQNESAKLEDRRYFGDVDLFGRYYLQGKEAPGRVYLQLAFGTQLNYWEYQRIRPKDQSEFNEPSINRFVYQNNSLSGGLGFQYRFASVWQAEAAALLRLIDKDRLDYGVRLSLGRVLIRQKA